MESAKKPELIDVYVDLPFLGKVFSRLNSIPPFSAEFDVLKSFLNYINEPHVRLIAADSGTSISKLDVQRVFLNSSIDTSNIRSRDYHFNRSYNFGQIDNKQSLFLGEEYAKCCQDLAKRFGFYFCDDQFFNEEWQRMMLLNKKQTFHIKATEDINEVDQFWAKALGEYQHPLCSIFICEPYLAGWDADKIDRNIVTILRNISNCRSCETNKIQLDIVYRTTSRYDKNKVKINNNLNQLYSILRRNLYDKFSFSIYLFDHEKLNNDSRVNGAVTSNLLRNGADFINQTLHDRNVFTNYLQFHSSHSFDFVEERHSKKLIRKDAQITVGTLLKEDYYKFAKSKIASYRKLIRFFSQDLVLKHYLYKRSN